MSNVEEDKVEEKIKSFLKAGEIAKKVKNRIMEEIHNFVSPGKPLLSLAERIEEYIKKEGGDYAFPTNICVNEIAAHFTPIDENVKFPDEGIVKIDFGVHINGIPVDNAFSVTIGENDEYKAMVETAEEAVKLAIKNFAVGKELSEIGEIINDYVDERGFKVIRNLNGHLLDEYDLHGEKEVPVTRGSKVIGKVEEGEVYAIEVFVTNGEGYAKATDEFYIFSLIPEIPKRFPIRIKAAREVLAFVRKHRKTLPFTIRWLKKDLDEKTVRIGVSALQQYGVLIGYPVLVEKGEGIIAQYEETILVKKDGVEILTL